jgi:hypothetical protein
VVKAIEVCLENIDLSEDDERYMRCVALADAEPGLCMDAEGEIHWMPADPQETGLWVSQDERLVLIRAGGEPRGALADSGSVWVERAGRSLEAPAGKPVVLLDQDVLRIGKKRLRVHVHGPTEQVFPPEPLAASLFKRLARSAAAVALGAATLAVSPIEVRARPPIVARVKVPVDCKIVKIDKQAKGLKLEAQCPGKTKVYKGMFGTLVDARKKPIPKSSVRITKVEKGKVWAEGKVTLGKSKAAAVRFMVND